MTTNAEHRKAMAELIRKAGSALHRVSLYWEQHELESMPDAGYPFGADLDELVASVWSWAETLEAPAAEPTAEQLDRWAQDIMVGVLDDTADHRIPLGIRTFADLHSYVDANEYLLGTPCPWGSDAATPDDEYGVRHHNALSDRVTVLLEATADALKADLRSKCTNTDHDHTASTDERGRDLDYTVPMICHHCYLPTHYTISTSTYQHDEAGKPCWLNGDRDESDTPCTPNDVIDLDELVDILKRMGIPAFTEMTGGGVATVYAGTVVGYQEDDANWPLYQCCAGPGWFEGPYYSQPRATLNEFYIGRDGDDTAIYDQQPAGFLDVVQRIIKLCK